jgi:hypothetical protein
MNYTELKTNIADICENTFTSDQYAMFTKQAEQRIYNSVQIPPLRKNQTGTLTTSNKYLIYPTDFLYPLSLALVDGSGDYNYLLNKDVNFMREAYPDPSTTGEPKHYAIFDATAFILGPTPDSGYTMELHYGYYPESIVTASTTWLGDNFDTVLLNGALIEAIRFLKGEPDMVALYEKMYMEALMLIDRYGDVKIRGDVYRDGQPRREVA